jgi:hypothetical protein
MTPVIFPLLLLGCWHADSPATPQQFEEAWLEETCEHAFDCVPEVVFLYGSVENCVLLNEPAEAPSLDGSCHYDEDAATECLDEYASSDCGDLDRGDPIPACWEVYSDDCF